MSNQIISEPCRYSSGGKGGGVTGHFLGLCSVATLDFGSPALRFDTAAATGCTLCTCKDRGSPGCYPGVSISGGARIPGVGKEISLCLMFPSVRQVLAVLTLEEQISMAAGTVERSLMLGVVEGCMFLLVPG